MNNDRKQHRECCIADNSEIGIRKLVLLVYEIEHKIHGSKEQDQPCEIFFYKRRFHELQDRQHTANADPINPGICIKAKIIQIFDLDCPHIKSCTNNPY